MVVRGVVVVVFGSMGGVCGVVGGMGDEGGGVEWLELAENGRFGGLREVMMIKISYLVRNIVLHLGNCHFWILQHEFGLGQGLFGWV